MNSLLLTVTGMTCGHCEKAIKTAIKTIDSQAEIVIDRAAATVAIQSEQPAHVFVEAITHEGYAVSVSGT